MKLCANERQISILYAINEELLKHRDNLQRALNGMAFYLPTGQQRAALDIEQARVTSMLCGISAMKRYWGTGIADHGQAKLSAEDYVALRIGAGVAHMQATHCQLDQAHPTFSTAEKQGLLDLFLYFDCKLDAADKYNMTYYTYESLASTVGYTAHIR